MIIFTRHALLKLKQRRISEVAVRMEITYDSKADALNISFKKGKIVKTVEIAPEINLDLDKDGKPLYLEIIGASEKMGKKRVNEILMRNLLPLNV